MAMGPVQVLVVGFGPDAEFKGEALDQLRLLREQDIVRVIDLLVVHHREDGTVASSRSPTMKSSRSSAPSPAP